jgi:hypothetical protein
MTAAATIILMFAWWRTPVEPPAAPVHVQTSTAAAGPESPSPASPPVAVSTPTPPPQPPATVAARAVRGAGDPSRATQPARRGGTAAIAEPSVQFSQDDIAAFHQFLGVLDPSRVDVKALATNSLPASVALPEVARLAIAPVVVPPLAPLGN